MGFLEDLGRKVTDAGQKAAQKTRELSDITRLELQVKREEGRRNQIYDRIGRLYVELHMEDFEEAFAEMIGEIREAEENIRSCKQQIEDAKNAAAARSTEDANARRCPNCGAAIPDDRRFCTACGSPLPRPSEPSDTGETVFCTNCGAKLASDAAFCEKCGTKV